MQFGFHPPIIITPLQQESDQADSQNTKPRSISGGLGSSWIPFSFDNGQEQERKRILETVYKNDRWCCPLCGDSFSLKSTLQRHLRSTKHSQDDPIVQEWLQNLMGRLNPHGRGPARPKVTLSQTVTGPAKLKVPMVSLLRPRIVPPPPVVIVQTNVAVGQDSQGPAESPGSSSQPKQETTQMSYL